MPSMSSLTHATGPCVIYMLRDMDIMEDLYDIRKVSVHEKMTEHRAHIHVIIQSFFHRVKQFKKLRERVRNRESLANHDQIYT